jgi:hypothetical protein
LKLNQERLKEVLEYFPENGYFFWRTSRQGCNRVAPAGSVDKLSGYVYITVDRVKYAAHRLAFLYMRNIWPKETVDHINNKRWDNSWNNLRLATYKQNLVNRGRMKSNTSGYVGVTRDRNMWKVTIAGKFLGRYHDLEEAAKVYKEAALETYGEFAHVSVVRRH